MGGSCRIWLGSFLPWEFLHIVQEINVGKANIQTGAWAACKPQARATTGHICAPVAIQRLLIGAPRAGLAGTWVSLFFFISKMSLS